MEGRRVTDRVEWSALARLAPSFAHEWSWSSHVADRLHQLGFFRLPTTFVYFRLWEDDSLVGCPFIILGDPARKHRAFNVPFSDPTVLSGEEVDASAAVSAAWPKATLHDHTGHFRLLWRRLRRLVNASTTESRSWAIDQRTLAAISDALRWPSEFERELWLRSLRRMWEAPWRTSIVTYRKHAELIGWAAFVHRDGYDDELFMVARVGDPPPWLSPRLPES